MSSSAAHPYCDYLGIQCPTISDYVGRSDVRPIQLFALTILKHGRPMTLSEVAGYLTSQGWVPATSDPELSLKKAWAGRLPIVQLTGDSYDLDLNCVELGMRLFELGIRTDIENNGYRKSLSLTPTPSEPILPPRRILVHGFRFEQQLVALSILNLDDRSLRTVYDEQLEAIPETLKKYSVIIGLEPRNVLTDLGVADVIGWRLIDLSRHPKSKQINKRGRKLAITTEMLITSSTGISKPLGDPIKLQEYWSHGKRSLLTKRMESDAKALYAFYRFGALHNFIRLRWGFLSESFSAEWAVPGERCLYELLKDKMEKGESVEFVRGTAPGWSDPWSRGAHAIVKAINYHDVVLLINGEQVHIPREEFQAVR